jgi:hypothetical protein
VRKGGGEFRKSMLTWKELERIEKTETRWEEIRRVEKS